MGIVVRLRGASFAERHRASADTGRGLSRRRALGADSRRQYFLWRQPDVAAAIRVATWIRRYRVRILRAGSRALRRDAVRCPGPGDRSLGKAQVAAVKLCRYRSLFL